MSQAVLPEGFWVRAVAGKLSWWKDRHGRYLRSLARGNSSRIAELERAVFLGLAERDDRIRSLEATVRRLEQEI